MSVNEKMTAIADAIREKTGGTELLGLDAMAQAIAAIGGVSVPIDKISAGIVVPTSGAVYTTIPHNLGVVPNFIVIVAPWYRGTTLSKMILSLVALNPSAQNTYYYAMGYINSNGSHVGYSYGNYPIYDKWGTDAVDMYTVVSSTYLRPGYDYYWIAGTWGE